MAQRKPEFEGRRIPATPVKPTKLPPDAPSAEKLAARAKKIAARPRKAKVEEQPTTEELSTEIKLAEHFALAETMARDTVDIMNVGMSHMDTMYDPEIKYVWKHRREKLTFEFTDTEGQTVGNACFSVYKKVDPARLAALGGWFTGIALVATVLLPRLKLASELRQLRVDLEEDAKSRQVAGQGPSASDARTPSSPSTMGLGVGGSNGGIAKG